jgi:TonB family protein
MKYLFGSIFVLLSIFGSAQQSYLFRTVYYPAEPFGGEKGLKEFIKQDMIYPEIALKNEIEGDVFITLKVDNQGTVIYKELSKNTDSLLRNEASRIFDRILWEPDPSRSNANLGFEKLKISFHPKKYLKLCKKRGYSSFSNLDSLLTEDPKFYKINAVDSKPEYTSSDNINKFIKQNFKYPPIALQQGLSGRVKVEFVIETYGKASNIRVIEPVGGGCNEETIRLVKLMDWEPAQKNGKPVRCLYEYSLNFVNPGGSVR